MLAALQLTCLAKHSTNECKALFQGITGCFDFMLAKVFVDYLGIIDWSCYLYKSTAFREGPLL